MSVPSTQESQKIPASRVPHTPLAFTPPAPARSGQSPSLFPCHPDRSGRLFPPLANASAGRTVEGSAFCLLTLRFRFLVSLFGNTFGYTEAGTVRRSYHRFSPSMIGAATGIKNARLRIIFQF
jgi:hypothetical protein